MEQKPTVGLQDSKKDNKAYVKHYYIMLCIPSSKYLKHDHGWTLNR